MPEQIRVLIVDDHPVVRVGIQAMLDPEPDIVVVSEAGSAAEAISRFRELRPSVVLMDLRMPGGGVEATSELVALEPACKVVILTTYRSDADIVRAIEAGAVGYLLKGVDRTEMASAVRRAHNGEAVMSPDVTAALTRRLRQPHSRDLTEREREVLSLVAEGFSNAETARRLFIEETTVKTHLLRAFAKLGVSDRTAAVTVAIRRGLIVLDASDG